MKAPFFLCTSILTLLWAANSALGQVASIPVSNKYIEGEIRFPDGGIASFQGREGALIIVRYSKPEPRKLGLIFHLSGDTKVKLLILKIEAQGDQGESASAVSPPKLEVSLGSKFVFRQSAPITILPQKVGEGHFPNSPSNLQNPSVYSSELCCVEFGGKEVCANLVKAPAGVCPK